MPAEERACFGKLLALSNQAGECDSPTLSQAVDGVLGCCRRYSCQSHLACSWVATELASQLIRRCR